MTEEQYNDFHVGDKAEELAEWDYTHLPMQELLDKFSDQWLDNEDMPTAMRKVWYNLRRYWLERAANEPEMVERLWRDLRGFPVT